MKEPEQPQGDQFDFDAHIARLIALSEHRVRSEVAPRGWGRDPAQKKASLQDIEEEEEEGSEVDSQWEDEDEEGESGSGCGDESPEEGEEEEGDEHFERVLGEYEEEDIGGLSDVRMPRCLSCLCMS